ncbi:hypothetical protein [Oceanirhabdus sp. W0125-5]|nr:hypothetical protein [Oceanirhabdus sp. W0125-5]WBW97916.1 hypothetical protein OW730_03820 [Oceanirhabdus sp. W0125-5]
MLFRKFNSLDINLGLNTEINIALNTKLNKINYFDNSTLMKAYY